MKVSVSLRSRYPVGDPRVSARHLVERARAAADAGLAALFVADHHGVADAHHFENAHTLGRLLAQWTDAPVGALHLLPLWHPVIVAEQSARCPPSRVGGSSCSARSAVTGLPWHGPAACVVGGPRRVAEELDALAGMGFTDVVIRHLADDQRDVLASFARLPDVRAMLTPWRSMSDSASVSARRRSK